jgi:hypothetical protein
MSTSINKMCDSVFDIARITMVAQIPSTINATDMEKLAAVYFVALRCPAKFPELRRFIGVG